MNIIVCCRTLWSRSSLFSATKAPLITFPPRRTSDGRPIIAVSIDNFTSSSNTTPSSKTPTITSNTSTVTLPTNYGRSPITQVEINMINSGGAEN